MTTEDLTGAMVLAVDPVTGIEAPTMRRQPLAEAYEDGHWLLLDELNLAPDEALQVGRSHAWHGVLHTNAIKQDMQ